MEVGRWKSTRGLQTQGAFNIVADDVRRRISVRTTIPPRYLRAYAIAAIRELKVTSDGLRARCPHSLREADITTTTQTEAWTPDSNQKPEFFRRTHRRCSMPLWRARQNCCAPVNWWPCRLKPFTASRPM